MRRSVICHLESDRVEQIGWLQVAIIGTKNGIGLIASLIVGGTAP